MAIGMMARGRMAVEAMRTRADAVFARWPTFRRGLPFALAIGINLLFALVILAVGFSRDLRGTPDAPETVTVFIVPPEAFPEPVAEEELAEPELTQPETSAPQGVADAEEELEESPVVEEAAAAPPVPEIAGGTPVPEVDLPDVDEGLGDPDGLVALNCFEQFSDPDKAQECAGREVLSGWQLEIQRGEDWAKMAEDLRRGGYERPSYGPDALAGMGANTRVFQPADPRYRNDTFDPEVKRYLRAFDSPQERAKYEALKDPRRYGSPFNEPAFADHGTPPSEALSGWRPSWMLREDPYIDDKTLSDFVLKVQENERNTDE